MVTRIPFDKVANRPPAEPSAGRIEADALFAACQFASSAIHQAKEDASAAGLDDDQVERIMRDGSMAGQILHKEAQSAPQAARKPFGSTWLPVELDDTVSGLVDGTLDRPTPTIGQVQSAGCLFYPGKVNGLAGESGSGKTWTALVVAAQEITAGENVVYVDLEDGPAGVVGRLLDLGADPDAIRHRLIYLSPDERLDSVARGLLVGMLEQAKPSLVVVDSTGEGLALQGANPNADEEVAAWFRQVPRLLTTTGAAVVVLDHVAKAHDGGLWPIGSQRKRAAIDGAQYMQDTIRAFSKETAGRAVLRCAKDRHGTYTAGQRVAELSVTPDGSGVVQATLVPAGDSTGADGRFRPTGIMERVSRVLEVATEPMTFNAIASSVTGKRQHVRAAVDALVAEAFLSTADGPRGATLHGSEKPFREDDDTGEPVAPPNRVQTTSDRFRFLGGEPGTGHFTESGNQSGTSREPVEIRTCRTCGTDLGAIDLDAGICGLCELQEAG